MNSTTPEMSQCIQTGVGSFQTFRINHNAIREDEPYLIDEYVTKEIIRTEVDWNENYFRYPIVKFGDEAKEVIKSDYLVEEFENGITRSIVYRHDDLISNEYTETNIELIKLLNTKESLIDEERISTRFLETRDSMEETTIKDKNLVIVKTDGESAKVATEEIIKQSNSTAEQAPVNSGITIVVTDVDKVDSDKRFDIKAGKLYSKPSKAIVKKNKVRRRTLDSKDTDIERAKQARIVKKETVTITQTERESSKITRKKQPLVNASKSRETKVRSVNDRMDTPSETPDEPSSWQDGERMEILTKEIDIDGKIESQVDVSDNTGMHVTDKITETAIVEQHTKSMEIIKTHGQGEFGFHLYGRKNYDGHFISQVEQGSGAHRAGLKVGDEIIEIDGQLTSEMNHTDVVDIIKKSDGPLSILVRNEIEKLKKAKNNLAQNEELKDDDDKSSLDFSNMDKARPKRKQAPKTINWKEKKKMFKNL